MRLGTQTLIQALQALPWMMSDDEEIPGGEAVPSEPESDDDRPTCASIEPSAAGFLTDS